MAEPPTYHNALPLGSMLAEYKLEAVLGAGGFGMTYLGWDTHLEKHVAIKPGNIFLRASGSPVLIDFGAARQAIGGATRSLTSVLTPGYAPLEQYASDGNQGPWSDIYAMSGVLYRALANDNPPDAVSRLKSDTISANLAALRGRVSQPFLRAVEWALALDEKQRPQNVIEWKRALVGEAVASATVRLAAPSARDAKTVAVAPAQPFPQAQTEQEPRQRPERPGSRWRWVGVGLALLAAVIVASAWNKQQQAKEQARLETAQLEAERRAEEKKRTRFTPAASGVSYETPGRERPPRDRAAAPSGTVTGEQ